MLTFKAFMDGHSAATIRCAYTNTVVRRIAVIGGIAEIHCADGTAIGVDLDTPIRYEAWFMDRGSLTFVSSELPQACKLCTEADLVTFEDGTGGYAMPDGVHGRDAWMHLIPDSETVTADEIRDLRENGPRTIDVLNDCDMALAALRGEFGAGVQRAEQALARCAERIRERETRFGLDEVS